MRKVIVAVFFLVAVYLGKIWNGELVWPTWTEDGTAGEEGILSGGDGSDGGLYEASAEECAGPLREAGYANQLCRRGVREVLGMSHDLQGSLPIMVDPKCKLKRTCLGDNAGSTVFPTVGEAVATAREGDTVLVGCGQYREASHVRITKPIHVTGDPRCSERPLIQAFRSSVVLFEAAHGSISNLALSQTGGHCEEGYPCSITGKAHPAVDIRRGGLVLQRCDIMSLNGGGIRVSGGSPIITQNDITRTGSFGLLFTSGAGGVAHENRILHARHVGVQLQEGASPLIHRNNITKGSESGIVVCSGARGLIEANLLLDHGLSSIEVDTSATPHIQRNIIKGSGQAGVFVHSGGSGLVNQNQIQGSQLAGIEVGSTGEPHVEENAVQDCKGPGVLIQSGGGGLVTENRVERSRGPEGTVQEGGVVSMPGAKARVLNNADG